MSLRSSLSRLLRVVALPLAVSACAATPGPGEGAAVKPDAADPLAGPQAAVLTSHDGAATVRSTMPSVPQSGQPAPALHLKNVEGGDFSLSALADPTGESSPKGVLVAFMASWCQYCSNSLPTLVAIEKANPDLEVVAVTVDDRPDMQTAELAKVRKAGLTGPVLVADQDAIRDWVGGGKSVPKYFFVNHNGLIVAHDDGFGGKVEPLMPKQAARALED